MAKTKLCNPWQEVEGYNCFGCAPGNPIGLRLEFHEEGEEIVSQWMPSPNYQGWLHILHGGIQATLLDEICGWCVFRKLQTTGVTSRMETRYLKPVRIEEGSPLTLRAKIVEQKRNWITIEAVMYGLIEIAKTENLENAPPEIKSINPASPCEFPIASFNAILLTPGTVI